MTARLAEMEEKTALLEKEVKTLKQAIQELEHTLSGLREDGEAFRTKRQDVKGRLYELEVAEKNINTHLEIYDQEKASLTESDREKETRKSALEEQLSEASGQLKELEEEMERLTKQKQTLSSTKETLSHELTECKVVSREKRTGVFE